MKLKILLVDDEYIVLKGLEIMLQNQKETALEIITAMNAVDAMDKISDWHPDVIIADINMPEIDGLSMLEQISKTHPLCRFIIVSGYEDHEYLKRALKLHVADYLTKPIDKTYLIRRLKEISDELQTQHRHVLMTIQMLLFQGNYSLRQDIISAEINRLFSNPNFALCTIPLSFEETELKEKQITAYFESCNIFSQNNWSVFLLNYSAQIQKKEIYEIFHKIFPGTVCGISLFSADPEPSAAIGDIYIYLQKSLCDLILSLVPIDVSFKEKISSQIALHTLQPAIRVLMFEYGISDYISATCNSDADPFENFLLIFTESVAAYMLTAGICPPTDTILQLYHSQRELVNDKFSFSSFLEKTRNLWYDSFTPTEQANYSSKIANACEYINTHYVEDISLEQTAEFVSINPSYLSYVFKKETGTTFLQYLTNIRLQKACDLMRANPEMSLEAISSKTGYHSASYFHKIFRAKYGVSPRQWLQKERSHSSF